MSQLTTLNTSENQRILIIRGQHVMLDAQLAGTYNVATKALNQAVKRNLDRFPSDFMFQLSKAERDEVVTNCDHLKQLKYSTVMPRAFTEHGVLMLGSLLNSDTAIQTSLLVVRAFVKLRALLSSHTELAAKLTELEQRTTNNDQAITELVDAVRRLIQTPTGNTRPIGFTAPI